MVVQYGIEQDIGIYFLATENWVDYTICSLSTFDKVTGVVIELHVTRKKITISKYVIK